MTTLIGKLIGIVFTAMGLLVLWASPVSSVACWRDAGGVSCNLNRSMLGLIPITGAQVHHILRAEVGQNSPPPDPSRPAANARPNDTYQLVFMTPEGRVAPRGVDASSSSPLSQIADQVNDLVSGNAERFSQSNYNGFPNVAGSIFLFVGLAMVLFAR